MCTDHSCMGLFSGIFPRAFFRCLTLLTLACHSLYAQAHPHDPCSRPEPGAVVTEPPDLRSHNGVLEVELTAVDSAQPDGSTRFCFSDRASNESPNLRVHPGDLVIVHLKNIQT